MRVFREKWDKIMLLQKVNSESEKPGSGLLLKVVLYMLSLGAAYLCGYYQHSKSHPAPVAETPEVVASAPTPAAPGSPAEAASPVPLASSLPSASSSPEALPSASVEAPPVAEGTPILIKRAEAVAPSPVVAAASTAQSPAPLLSLPAAGAVPTPSPLKQLSSVTVTEPVQIPVKDDDGKITGYINLQKGQSITPLSVKDGQIKIKSGKSTVMVPVSSTDMH